MIPSRSLSLIEIISESVRTSARTFARYGILFLLLSVPGACLVTIGVTNFSTGAISGARHEINFSDSDLTRLRDNIESLLAEQNPLLFPGKDTTTARVGASADTSNMQSKNIENLDASSRQIANYLKTNISQFASPIILAIIGFVINLFGMTALAGAATDFACHDFEERPLELWRSLFDSLKRNSWKILFLYVLWMSANGIAGSIANVIPGEAGNMMSGFVTMAEIYLAIRLIATVPALVSEELGPFKAIARSWELTRRSGWRIFGISLVFGFMLFSVSTIVSIIAGFIFTDVASWATEFFGSGPITVQWLIESVPTFLAEAAAYSSVIMLVVFALLPSFGTVLYYDLRTRHDGLLVYLDERA